MVFFLILPVLLAHTVVTFRYNITTHEYVHGYYFFFQMTEEEICALLSDRNGDSDLDYIPLTLDHHRNVVDTYTDALQQHASPPTLNLQRDVILAERRYNCFCAGYECVKLSETVRTCHVFFPVHTSL